MMILSYWYVGERGLELCSFKDDFDYRLLGNLPYAFVPNRILNSYKENSGIDDGKSRNLEDEWSPQIMFSLVGWNLVHKLLDLFLNILMKKLSSERLYKQSRM